MPVSTGAWPKARTVPCSRGPQGLLYQVIHHIFSTPRLILLSVSVCLLVCLFLRRRPGRSEN